MCTLNYKKFTRCLLWAGFLATIFAQAPPEFDHGVDLPTTRPLNIAHRGSSGQYPDHTVRAYQAAVDEGADVIECDLSVTMDLQLVCLHESWLSGTTNVAEVYPEERMNTYFVIDQGRFITDYFSVDFTLEELREIRAVQRYSYRDPNYNGQFPISSLADYIEIAQNAGRPVGLYPETKDTNWVNSLDILTEANTTFEDLLVQELSSYGYTGSRDPCFLQSFSDASARAMASKTDLPVMLLPLTPSDARLDDIAEYAYGIGATRRTLVTVSDNQITGRTDLADRAHARGLKIHA